MGSQKHSKCLDGRFRHSCFWEGRNFTLVSSSGNFVSAGSGIASVSAGVGTVQAAISDAVAASDFQCLLVKVGISLVLH